MLHVLDHPMIKHKLTTMRKIETGTKDFRQNLDEIAALMAYEVTRDFPTRDIDIETPMGNKSPYVYGTDSIEHLKALISSYNFNISHYTVKIYKTDDIRSYDSDSGQICFNRDTAELFGFYGDR